MKKKLTLGRFAIHVFFILFCIMCIIPFLTVISISLSNEKDILEYGYRIIPYKIDLEAYRYIFQSPQQLLQSYWVTIFTTVVGTLLSVTIMGMLGYNISRKNNKWRKPIAFYVFFTMLFSGGLVPGYILITKYLNLADTVWVLILPGLVNAWHIILFSTFFRSIPDALCESAKIDGASEIKIFYKIIIPLSKPSIATIALFGVLARWNDWYTCLLYIRSEHLLTLQYLLQRIMTDIQSLKDAVNNVGSSISLQDLPSETVKMAMVVLAAGPMLFVFPFFQKYFVKGLTVGSVKG